MTHERMRGTLEQVVGRTHLHRASARHHHHPLGERQGLGLVVRDIDQGQLELVVDFLQLAPQLPLQVRVDHRQRLVEQDGRHIAAHQAAPQRDLLLGVRRQAAGAALQHRRQLQHFGDAADPLADMRLRHAPVAQRKGQVVGHRHRVVDHRKLEDLGDVALLRRAAGHILAVEQHPALRRPQQAGHAIEQGGLAAARRPQQGVGPAVLEGEAQRQQRVVVLAARIGAIGVRQVELDAGHQRSPAARRRQQRAVRPEGVAVGRIEMQRQARIQRIAVHAGQLRHDRTGGRAHMHERIRSGNLGQLHHARQGHVGAARLGAEHPGAQSRRQRIVAGLRRRQRARHHHARGQHETAVGAPRREQVHGGIAEGPRHPDGIGAMEDLGGRTVLQQPAGVEHRGMAAQQQGLGGLGGGIDHGRAPLGEQAGQLFAQGFAQLVVQVDQRFVQQHQRRVLDQRARQRHALLLAAGQFGRIAVQQVLDMQAFGHGPHARRDIGGAAQAQRRGDVVGHPHRRVVDELLVHHGDVALAHRHAGDIGPVDQHLALGGAVQPGHDAHHRGLAGQGRPQQHGHGARRGLQAERVQVYL
ncbi:Uncharacterised protein [Bordetella pertussis]|nr:Uncharacterised protein [Bordetella pertussis]CFL78487.1 Uncharacterised protein [Bordetella pertussis]CFN59943.1 Uncharacterised protein [Bordetella pertussis]CFN61225.1 Uncharacterised protein [Bordetella pertussis]CFN78551.1 Uncharacterised protein [Bordetella pertussis]